MVSLWSCSCRLGHWLSYRAESPSSYSTSCWRRNHHRRCTSTPSSLQAQWFDDQVARLRIFSRGFGAWRHRVFLHSAFPYPTYLCRRSHAWIPSFVSHRRRERSLFVLRNSGRHGHATLYVPGFGYRSTSTTSIRSAGRPRASGRQRRPYREVSTFRRSHPIMPEILGGGARHFTLHICHVCEQRHPHRGRLSTLS